MFLLLVSVSFSKYVFFSTLFYIFYLVGGFLCNIGKECFYYSPMIIVKKKFFFDTK